MREVSNNIVFKDDKMVIKEYIINDSEIISFFKNYSNTPELNYLFVRALKIGTIGLKNIEITENIDYIQKEFNNLDKKLNNTIDNAVIVINEKLQEIFDANGTSNDLFNPDKKGTPLYTLKQSLLQEITQIKDRLIGQEINEEIKSKTTLKGFEFEDYCEKLLSRIAKLNGDHLERTSNKIGRVTLSKKGDFVITLSDINKRIVFELKNGGKFSLKRIQRILEEAIRNRDATYGIFVVKDVKSLPEYVGWFNEYNGNQLVCALGDGMNDITLHDEILYIAYKWAKLKNLLEISNTKKLDSRTLKMKEAIRNKLDELDAVKTHCRNIIKHIKQDINEEFEDMIYKSDI